MEERWIVLGITFLVGLAIGIFLGVWGGKFLLKGPRREMVLCDKIADGDTVRVVRGDSKVFVRLIGVDTPEKWRKGVCLARN